MTTVRKPSLAVRLPVRLRAAGCALPVRLPRPRPLLRISFSSQACVLYVLPLPLVASSQASMQRRVWHRQMHTQRCRLLQ